MKELFSSPYPYKTQSIPGSCDKYKPKLHVSGRGTQYVIKAGQTGCTLKAQLEHCHPYFTLIFSISPHMKQVESHMVNKI